MKNIKTKYKPHKRNYLLKNLKYRKDLLLFETNILMQGEKKKKKREKGLFYIFSLNFFMLYFHLNLN